MKTRRSASILILLALTGPVLAAPSLALPSASPESTPVPVTKKSRPLKSSKPRSTFKAATDAASPLPVVKPTRPSPWTAHVGPAFVFQNSAGVAGQSLGMRLFVSRLLSQKNNFSARYLGTFKSLGSTRFSNPQWAMLTWEHRICGGGCASSAEVWIPRFYGVFGVERYSNAGRDEMQGADFIQSYLAPVVGFRSRFDLFGPWEIGGDLLYNRISSKSDINGYKWHVQGDISFNLSGTQTLGVGYWVEWAHVPLRDLTERSIALEAFVEMKF